MEETKKKVELLSHNVLQEVTYKYSAGDMASRFFHEIQVNKKFYGVKCPKCSRVWMPPRIICRECFQEMHEWVEVGPKATVIGYTAPQHAFPDPLTGKIRKVPYGFGLINLDGASNNFSYFLEESDHTKMKVGMRVEAVFAEERVGDFNDVIHFRTIGEGEKSVTLQVNKEALLSEDYSQTVVTQHLKVPYTYTLGKTLSEFFSFLRDEGKIMGKKCPECKDVLFPPRSSCGRCFSRTTDWVEISGQGVLESFTIVRYEEPTLPEKPPYVLGLIKLDGASGGISHLIKEVQPDQVKIGMKVQAVIKKERQGNINDIDYFKPL